MTHRSPFARREAPAYRIVAGPSSETADIQLYDEIGYFGVTANDFVRDLKAISADTIHLRINSPGGSVFDGLAIHNALKAHPAHIVVHIDGLAASIASVIALAADEVRIAPTAFFMIHNAWTFAIGDAKELRKTADTLEKVGGSLVETYIAATGKPRSQIVAWMNEETWFTAAEALEHGFATALDEPDDDEDVIAAVARFDLSVFRRVPPALTGRPAASRRTGLRLVAAAMKTGDRIRVRPGKEHDPKMKGATGTIAEVSTAALGIRFDDMPGIHRWHVESELEHTDEPDDAGDDDEGDDGGMKMHAPPSRRLAAHVSSSPTKRTIERALRDAGLSRSDAKAVAASGLATLAQRDAATDGAVAPPPVSDDAALSAAAATAIANLK